LVYMNAFLHDQLYPCVVCNFVLTTGQISPYVQVYAL